MKTLERKSPLYRKANEFKIEILLISILMLVLVPPYLSNNENIIDIYIKVNFGLILAACYLVIQHNNWSKYLTLVSIILLILDQFLVQNLLHYGYQTGVTILIVHAFFLVVKEAMSIGSSRSDMILVSVTGYMIIGLLGGFLADGLNDIIPGSYTHSTGMELGLYNFIYYSYVTMTTLGYGDIIPASEKSQSLAMLLVISGQLFLSIIIAMNIAKFMQKRMSD